MAMMEIFIPEMVIVLFLALPLFRPFTKMLIPLDGLMWLPLIALVIAIGIFPAYGFRPECLPILIYALVYAISNLLHIKDSFRNKGPLFTVCMIILLGTVAIPMFAFPPPIHMNMEEAETAKVEKINNRITGSHGAYNREYSLLIYGAVQADRPLIFLVPPEIGSAASVNLVCRELQKYNYTVVTYTRKENVPFRIDKNTWIRSIFPARLLRYWLVSGKAAGLALVNELGKIMETERRTEIEFLLSRLPAFVDVTGNDRLPPFLLVGYGAGGSALAYLAGESEFVLRHANVLGVVAIESRLWSSYLPVPRDIPKTPVDDNIVLRYWTIAVNYFNSIRPQGISRNGPLPGNGNSDSGFPVLYLISGRALDSPQKFYQAVFDILRSGSHPVALAAIQETGPLDYQDYPVTHPLYSFLLPGRKDAQKNAAKKHEDPIGDTAGIIGNFASFLFNRSNGTTSDHHEINGSPYVESKGMPGFRL
jgi:hypothetical protein